MNDWSDLQQYKGELKRGGHSAKELYLSIQKPIFIARLSKAICCQIFNENYVKLAISKDRNFIVLSFHKEQSQISLKFTKRNNNFTFSIRSLINFFNLKDHNIFNKRLNVHFEEIQGHGNCLVVDLIDPKNQQNQS